MVFFGCPRTTSTLTCPQTPWLCCQHVERCCFLHCKSRLSLYALPKDEDAKSQWLKLPQWYHSSITFSCFPPQCIDNCFSKLKEDLQNAYPSKMQKYPLYLDQLSSESQPVSMTNYWFICFILSGEKYIVLYFILCTLSAQVHSS